MVHIVPGGDVYAGFYFETGIIIVNSLLLGLIFRKYQEKRHQFTLMLFQIFLLYMIAVIFSWITKLFVILYQWNQLPPTTPYFWFIGRIIDFRFSFAFVVLALILTHTFKVKIFNESETQVKKNGFLIYSLFTLGWVLFMYDVESALYSTLNVLSFLFIFLLMAHTYGSFMLQAVKIRRSVQDPHIKSAFLTLTVMCIWFVLTFLFFFLDNLMIFFGDEGYTLFYFMAWSSVLLAVIFTYLGYIRPKSKEK